MKNLFNVFISLIAISFLNAQENALLLAELKMESNKIIKSSDIEIDGSLNESIWDKAIRLDQFTQSSPQLGVPASERTEVMIHYDKEFLYVGVKAFDQNPNLIFASVLGRDEILQSDDYVEVIIDSYNDKTNALAFATNPLGTRVDYEIAQNGQNFNPAWNTFWQVSSQLTDFGWSAEYKIPWSSLRYEAQTVNTMAFKVIRYIKHKNETDIFPLKNKDINNRDYHMENTQEIDIEGLTNTNPLYFVPYVASNIEQNYELSDDETRYERTANGINRKNYVESSGLDKILSNIGFDLKYKLNNNNTLDITVNTDFAQAEADDRVVNISRFSIFQPEKRSFFLENANLFQSQMTFGDQLFHSRTIGIEEDKDGDKQIVPIIAGARLSGKSDRLEYGFMNLQTKSDDLHGIESLNYTVMRPKYSLAGGESYIGALVTSKHSTESASYNRVASLDSKMKLSENLYLDAYAAASYDHDTDQKDNLAYGLELSNYPPSGYTFNLVLQEYQNNFNPEMGFIQQSDLKRLAAWNGWSWVLNDHSWISTMGTGYWTAKRWESTSNRLANYEGNFFFRLLTKSGIKIFSTPLQHEEDYLFEEWEFSDDITIPAQKYVMNRFWMNFDSGNGSDYRYSFQTLIGDFYGGSIVSFSPSINYIFSQNFNADLGVNYNGIKFPAEFSSTGKTDESRTVFTGRFNYAFSPTTSLKALMQYDNVSESMGSNIRLRYNPMEGTDFYLVYNQNYNTNRFLESPVLPAIQNQSLILKFSHTFIY